MIPKLAENDFQKFRELIYNESGIHFTSFNRSILESRVGFILKERELPSAGTYYKEVSSNRSELRNFIDSVTTNLTKFFRNDSHFNALREEVLPALIERKKKEKKLHLWSAGCSTGEEPYSLIIQLLEMIPDHESWDIRCYASDISLKTLMRAKRGMYNKSNVKDIPKNLLEKYFDHYEDDYQIKPVISKKVKFDYHNLLHTTKFSDIDMVFCRNVIIYFDDIVQKKVVDIIYSTLGESGFFFIGHSESLLNMSTEFKLQKSVHTTYYIKGEASKLGISG